MLAHESGQLLKTWVFVMTLSWSRHQYAEVVFDQTVETLLACHRRAFEWFGGRPNKIIVDNAKCAIVRACTYDPEAQRSYASLNEGYGVKIDAGPPHDPQDKGVVDSGVKYVKKSFMSLRTFRNLPDANRQLRDRRRAAWCAESQARPDVPRTRRAGRRPPAAWPRPTSVGARSRHA